MTAGADGELSVDDVKPVLKSEACVHRLKIGADHVYHQAVVIAHDVPPLRTSSLTRGMEPAKKREQ